MIHCKDCVFWNPRKKQDEDYKRSGFYDRHGCLCPMFLYGYSDLECPPSGACIEDDEGWAIETGPDFGCVHGKARE